MKAIVVVTFKEGVLDPQGSAVRNSLHSLDFREVSDVRIGKHMELTVENGLSREQVYARVREMCDKLLANPVIEQYQIEVLEEQP